MRPKRLSNAWERGIRKSHSGGSNRFVFTPSHTKAAYVIPLYLIHFISSQINSQVTTQAFVVTAGLVLGLDLFHRVGKGAEATEDAASVSEAIRILAQWPTSSVASHGIRLLTTLLEEHAKNATSTAADDDTAAATTTTKRDAARAAQDRGPAFPVNVAPLALAEAATGTTPLPPLPPQSVNVPQPDVTQGFGADAGAGLGVGGEPWLGLDFDVDMLGFDGLVDPGVNSNMFFDGIFGVSGHSAYVGQQPFF